ASRVLQIITAATARACFLAFFFILTPLSYSIGFLWLHHIGITPPYHGNCDEMQKTGIRRQNPALTA
ncbi:hypothetical protein, partial [Pseudoduganella sp. RAF53_2]|uniref:hypothetical protein n=1 Tax=Pseudoduganella sp. RAF53_2 TaxID=3233060 RepID=UPI003F9790B9